MIFKRITMLAAVLTASAFVWFTPKISAYDDISLVEKCGTRYGYDYLEQCTDPEGKQKLYNDIYDRVCEIWQSDEDFVADKSGYIVIGKYDLNEYGLSDNDDGLEVLFTLKNDNPIFYYISNMVALSKRSNKMTVLMFPEYSSGEVRMAAQDDIYNYLNVRSEEMSAEPTLYRKVKLLHDTLVEDCEYEKQNGKPSGRSAAHNILGVIQDNTGVCESYARTFEMVLNYSGIDNVLVTGIANYDNHAWNIAKMDDGNYYYFDTTWDDLLSTDRYLAAGTDTMSKSHEESKPTLRGMDFLYELPFVGKEDFVPEAYHDDSSEKDDSSKIDKPDGKLGDVNGDGKIDVEDAVMVIGHVNGVKALTNEELKRADVDGNGKIDIEDAVAIIAHVNGIRLIG